MNALIIKKKSETKVIPQTCNQCYFMCEDCICGRYCDGCKNIILNCKCEKEEIKVLPCKEELPPLYCDVCKSINCECKEKVIPILYCKVCGNTKCTCNDLTCKFCGKKDKNDCFCCEKCKNTFDNCVCGIPCGFCKKKGLKCVCCPYCYMGGCNHYNGFSVGWIKSYLMISENISTNAGADSGASVRC